MFATVLQYISILSPLLVLLVGIRKWKSFLWFYCLADLVADLSISMVRYILHGNFQLLAILYMPLEFILLTLIFNYKFKLPKSWLAALIITPILIYSYLAIQNGAKYTMTPGSVFSFTYIIFTLLGYYFIIKEPKAIFLDRDWFFWFCTAVAMYAAGSFLIFLFFDYIKNHSMSMLAKLWTYVFTILNLLKNILLTFSIWRFTKSSHEPH
ncbi:MAG: hypothetical protein JSS64_10735 [Bacteroidetes bacterium]|nr:hypothetical protein [Bacteroidota bacterium]